MSASDSFVSPDDATAASPSGSKILHVVVLVGLLPGIYCISSPYPLLESGPVLLGAAVLYICAICVVIGAPAEGRGSPKYWMVALIPWLVAGVCVANGALDHSPEVLHSTEVVDSEYYLRGWNIIKVQSWRPGQTDESLYLKTWLLDSRGFYVEGQPLTVGVKSGALGMPWLTQVTRVRRPVRRSSGMSAPEFFRGFSGRPAPGRAF